MGRFILQRMVYGLATLAGVTVLVFLLFHTVGGGAARFALPAYAPVTERDAFDEARGFHRPAFMGNWQRDGSLGDGTLALDAGPLGHDPRVIHRTAEGPLPGRVGLPPGAPYEIRIARPLAPDRAYRCKVTYRTADDSVASCRATGAADGAAAVAETPMPPTRGWQVAVLSLDPLSGGRERRAWIEVGVADIEVAAIALDRQTASPFAGQPAHFLGRVVRLDLGRSQRTGQPVGRLLRDGAGPTLALMIPMGLLGAAGAAGAARWRRGRRIVAGAAACLCSVHVLVLVFAAQYLIAMKWRWLPLWGMESPVYLVLPVLTGGVLLAAHASFTRGGRSVDDVAAVLRAAVPVWITLDLLLETLCGIPGIGYAAVLAARGGDVDVLQGVVLAAAVAWIGLKIAVEAGGYALARRETTS